MGGNLELILRTETLTESEIRWGIWFMVLFAGIFCGAAADLFSLWLFAHWVSR